MLPRDGPPGPVTSIGKLFFCPLVEDIADFGLELDEMGGQFALAEKGVADSSTASQQRWMRLAYQARGTAIAGGSTFIQRNIAAERILGMPRELRPGVMTRLWTKSWPRQLRQSPM